MSNKSRILTFCFLDDSVPLPEDEELTGFLPLENALKGLRFPNHAAWDTYGGRVPDLDEEAEDDSAE